MSGLAIYMSNRMEVLAERLSETLRKPCGDVLEPEIVVVQSRGMQRWLSLELARRNGVCANVSFPFPRAFLTDMACRLAPDSDLDTEADATRLTLQLMRLLPGFLGRPGFQRLNRYLADDPKRLKLLQLCQRIAFLFDQYRVYRPDLLRHWEAGRVETNPDSRWQAHLWRALATGPDAAQRKQWPQVLSEAIDGKGSADRIPKRAAIFGISYLPPMYFQLISGLSRGMALSLFWMNPSREYWGDIVSERQMHRLRRRSVPEAADLHLESGNRLLAACGALGRSFMQMLVDTDGQVFDHYEEPAAETRLSSLQRNIFYLRNAAEADAGGDPASGTIDPSVQVHSCHSPLRETEVLRDYLLSLFDADPDLEPDDIIVMAPDIEAYAPFIQAIFGTRTPRGTSIPFSIADRSARRTNRMVEGVMALLDVAESRFGAAEIFRLLEFPGIKERFGLEGSELHRIENWVHKSEIRWGADARMREASGLPGFKENTWSEGFRRMLLGYALPTEEKALFRGILPFDQIEGRDTVTLGNFIDFVTRVFELKPVLAASRPMSEWQRVLSGLLEDFFSATGDQQRHLQQLRKTINRLAASAAEAGYDEAMDLGLLRQWLPELLQDAGGPGGFLGQGVTFCAMLPMRSIPFKVVCLIGMDNAAFPRDAQPLDFDLMARNPRPGDRSRRDDDRYLFLEAILSARQALYISYTGQSIQDNSTIPPSVLVRELLDVLQSPAPDAGQPPGHQLSVKHRLQPFSTDYFTGGQRRFSYSQINRAICERLSEAKPEAPFFDGTVRLAENDRAVWQQIDLNRLAVYWSHPCRFLLRNRLGLVLESDDTVLKDDERFLLSGLDRYQLGEKLLQRVLRQPEISDPYPLWAASGQLPPANAGRTAFDQLSGEVEMFAERLGERRAAGERLNLEVDYRFKNFHLSGVVPNAYPEGCVTARFANTKARDLLKAWIYHLGYGLSAAPAKPVSYLYCRDDTWQFQPVEKSRAIIDALMGLYLEGLSEPLFFVPQTAYAFADALLRRNRSREAALQAARKTWQGNDYVPGEAQDPYVQLCFRGKELFVEAFMRLSLQVWEPMFDHLRRLSK
jgi:exodeoxyribonuclease V gamma subunit